MPSEVAQGRTDAPTQSAKGQKQERKKNETESVKRAKNMRVQGSRQTRIAGSTGLLIMEVG